MKLTEEQEVLLKQIVHSFRLGVGGEEGPTWEEHDRDRELEVLHLLAIKYGYHLLRIDPEFEWKDDDV